MSQSEVTEENKFQGTEELDKFNHSIFDIPNFNSATYKNNICQVFQKVRELDNFTDNLQHKVDSLLEAQLSEFVNAYKSHMRKIKIQFKVFETEMLKQQQQIKYYQNQGKMSNLVKKVALLEDQSKNLYAVISKKDKEIKQLTLNNKVQTQQNKRLLNQIKEMLRTKHQKEDKEDQQNSKLRTKSKKSDFFPTQVLQAQRSIKRQLSQTTDEKGQNQLICHLSQNSIQGIYESKQIYNNTLRKKINQLQLKNRKLASINIKVLDSRNQFENLFFDAVNEVKKQIKLRKKIRSCTYEDFSKEDKLHLLVTIVSNEQLLKLVYQRLFSRNFYTSLKDTLNQEDDNRFREANSEYLSKNKNFVERRESSINLSEQNQCPQKIIRRKHPSNRRGQVDDLSIFPYL